MTTGLLIALSAGGLFLAGLGATGAKILADYSLGELETYCRQREREQLLDEILRSGERVAQGVESLQLVGTATFLIAGLLAAQAVAREQFLVGWQWSAGIALAILVILATVHWVPWAIAEIWAAPLLFHSWRLWHLCEVLSRPLSFGERFCEAVLRRLAGRPTPVTSEAEAFEEEILTMVSAGERDGLLEADAREMIEGVMELGDVEVSHIMTPRSEVAAVDVDWDWTRTMRFVIDTGHTRIPVYQKDLDHVVGILYVKDLLPELSAGNGRPARALRSLLRPAWFVPESKRVDELLGEFLRTRSHMAVVLDEFHAVRGVVTIEDALEEIVGEIDDEYDLEQAQEITRIDDHTSEVVGRTQLDRLNESLGLMLPETDEVDTIAGLVVSHLRRIPRAGEVLVLGDTRITVLETGRRRIERLRLEKLDRVAPTDANGETTSNGADLKATG